MLGVRDRNFADTGTCRQKSGGGGGGAKNAQEKRRRYEEMIAMGGDIPDQTQSEDIVECPPSTHE